MEDQFLDMNDEDIDNLLFGINISDIKQVNDNICISCKSGNMAIDETQGYNVCMDCGVVNNTYLNKNPTFNNSFKTYSLRSGRRSKFIYIICLMSVIFVRDVVILLI